MTQDSIFEQAANISKAYAYDILVPKLNELEREVIQLRSDTAQLKIRLQAEIKRVEMYKAMLNDPEVRPEGAIFVELGQTDREIEQEFADHKDKDKDDLPFDDIYYLK